MRTLAIETVESAGSIAALDDGVLVAQQLLDPELRSARSLAPGIRDLLASLGWPLDSLRLITVATGPGSFTGLRIGVTTAKSLAYALGCQVAGVGTLPAIAWRAPAADIPLWAVLDAGRGEIYAAEYQRATDRVIELAPPRIASADTWLAGLTGDRAVTGPALTRLAARLPACVRAIAPEYWPATAEAVGQLGWRQFASGQRDDLFQLVPQYLRRIAAEEQWEKRQS